MTNLPDAPTYPRFLQTCPWWLLHYSPAVAEVGQLYGWRADGCLDPLTLDVHTRRAVEAYAAGVAHGQADRQAEAARRREHDRQVQKHLR